jgi:hypothetical protein
MIEQRKVAKFMRALSIALDDYRTQIPSNFRSTGLKPTGVPQKYADRFWQYVDKSNEPSGCWIWTGNTTLNGYGRMLVGRKLLAAHRISYFGNNIES